MLAIVARIWRTMANADPISKAHPWIDFRFDVRRLDYRTWIELGECDSKCEHIVNTPLSPELRNRLHLIYLSKGAHATTAIEGNTLTEEQVRDLVQDRLRLPKSKAYLEREVRNIIVAVNLIAQRIRDEAEPPITPELLCEYNQLVLQGLELEKEVIPGRPRRHAVGVARYAPPEWPLVPEMMERLCSRLREFGRQEEIAPRVCAILQAVFAHLYVAWIHPFGDGNGRTARLLEFDLLLRSGVTSAAAHLLSNHYNQTRTEYYRRLDTASRQRDTTGFVAYAIRGFRDGLREQLDSVNSYVRKYVWINYVHDRFSRLKHSPTRRRQRDLVLALTDQEGPVPKERLPIISPRMHNRYRDKTGKTVTRDINALLDMDLIRLEASETGPGYVANMVLMDTFLPLLRRDDTKENRS